MMPTTSGERITLRVLRRMAADDRKIAMLSCYDATTARQLEAGGVHGLIVGDSAAQMILGFDQTIHAPLDFMIQITAAAKRGAPNCFVMGDMPFMSYQADDAEAIRNAGRFMTEGTADAVKVEVDGSFGDLVAKLSRAGIPVVAHIGWRPQQARHAGVQTAVIAGSKAQDAALLIEQAELMEARGAQILLIEQCTAEASAKVVERVSIPVIGCGAGPACHGHVVVLHDLLGLSERSPSFAQPLASMGHEVTETAGKWVELVQSGQYLQDHPYHMAPGEAEDFGSR